MRLFVRDLAGWTFPVVVDEGANVAHLQQEIAAAGAPQDEHRLIFGGRELARDELLEGCGLQDDSTVFVSAKLSGGSKKKTHRKPKKANKGKKAQLRQASVIELFHFLQCQLCMEAKHVLNEDVKIKDPGAVAMFPDYVKCVTPNLGRNERWVPYHTAFGVHERFLIEHVHHGVCKNFNEKRRFLALFVFRAHCKCELFTKVQLPHLKKETFWKDPQGQFRPEGRMEKAILKFRKDTKKPLLTLAFRMIPKRVCTDDDKNLVRSITSRTQVLLQVAEQAWPVIKDTKNTAAEKFDKISRLIRDGPGLGETWSKMIMVSLDIAYPEIGLLHAVCEVGIGATAPLRALLPGGGPASPQKALQQLTGRLNRKAGLSSAKHFWALLKEVEKKARDKFKKFPLFLRQVSTKQFAMSNVTCQVQLCEYRQFRNGLAKIRSGLPGDDSMKLDKKEKRLRPEDYFNFDERKKLLTFEVPSKHDKTFRPFEVSVAATGNSRRLAERVAMMCFDKIRENVPIKAVKRFRKELYQSCKAMGQQDVPADCIAWQKCRGSPKQAVHVVSFSFEMANGTKETFQTTSRATGGNLLEAERIARLCYKKFMAGAKKDEVLAYRTKLYKESEGRSGSAPAGANKRPREASSAAETKKAAAGNKRPRTA